ncbi:MAG TPA: radical SAM protein [Candidatus Wallbacteria bacterium]|nr:radical SAM protein [Candidatus Wallbacteria bacterium]
MKKTAVSKGNILLLYVNRLGAGNLYQSSEPLGLNSLAAFVEDKGYFARVYSGPVHEAAKILTGADSEKCFDAIGLYCDFETVSTVESFSSFIKEKTSARVFIGGPQAVALGESFLKKSRCDAVVRGEGEYPLYELLEFFLHGRGRIEDIAGASYLDSAGNFVQIPPRPPIAQVDLLPLRKAGADARPGKTVKNYSILTGRGCPFRCAFCYEGSVSAGVRLRSVDKSLAEIERALVNNPAIKYIWFADDTFTLSPSRMEAFSKGLAKLRRNFDFAWFCECHPSAMIKWPDTLSMMVESGLVRMQIGMESGDARVISLYKKQASLEDIQRTVELSYKSGLPQLTGNMIIGGAAESKATFKKTAAFAKKLIELGPGMTDITSTFFLPLPGTAITLAPSEFDLKFTDPGSITSIGDMAVVETKKLSREQIVSMRLDFTRKILSSMVGVYKKGKIPVKRIIDEFRINKNYGLESNWYKVVYSPDRFIDNYYKKMAAGVFISSDGASRETLMQLYPTAVIDTAEMIDLTGDFPKVGGYALSPLEYRILSLCTGDSPLHAILDKVFEAFVGNYSSKNEFNRAALKIMKNFEEKLWAGYLKTPCGKNKLEFNNIDIRGAAAPEIIPLRGSGRIDENKLKALADGGVKRIVVDMPAGSDLKELRAAVENCLKAGIEIITGRLSGFAGAVKTARAALALIDEYPAIFEAYYDSDCLKNMVFNSDAEREEYVAASQRVITDVFKKMAKLSAARAIDYETVLRHFKLYEERGIKSIYYDKIFSADHLIYNYFTIISRGGGARSREINDKCLNGSGLSSFRPQRTMAVWTAVNFEKGYPAIGPDVLSPLEYELLLHCTGKSTLAEIYGIISEKFSRCFDRFEELKNSVDIILSDFEKKYWMIFSRI